MTDSTAQLSRLELLKTWHMVWVSYFPALLVLSFLMATVTCQGIPRFQNQSLSLSRYFLGINFMAQSCMNRTDVSSKSRRISRIALSWFTKRNKCDFQAFISRLAFLVMNASYSCICTAFGKIFQDSLPSTASTSPKVTARALN